MGHRTPGNRQLVYSVHNGLGTYIHILANHSVKGTPRQKRFEQLDDTYLRMAHSRPLQLALAILECFRSFSEVGGFFMQDLYPDQFMVRMEDGQVKFVLVDGPTPYWGPVSSLVSLNTSHGPVGYPPISAPSCHVHEDCPASHVPMLLQSVLAHEGRQRCNITTLRATPVGAPETRGHCAPPNSHPAVPLSAMRGSTTRAWQPLPLAHATSPKRCTPLSYKTHVYDVATKNWLLPIAAMHSQEVASLLPLMSKALPSKRPSFSECINILSLHLQNSSASAARRRRNYTSPNNPGKWPP